MVKIDCFAGAPLPDNLSPLVPSGEKTAPLSGVLKATRSSHNDESMVHSHCRHDRRVAWGEPGVQDIKKIGRYFKENKSYQGYHEYRKRRVLLQYILDKDAEIYQGHFYSDPRIAVELSVEEAKDLFAGVLALQLPMDKVFKDMITTRDDGERRLYFGLYCASYRLLAWRHLDFRSRLRIHRHLAYAQDNRQHAAYHADIALEMVLKALDIPAGPFKAKYNVVDGAMKTDLQHELAISQELLAIINESHRVNVCWDRLPQGGEGQRLYMENPDYKEVIQQVSSQPVDGCG